jgi:hypothetical protein
METSGNGNPVVKGATIHTNDFLTDILKARLMLGHY